VRAVLQEYQLLRRILFEVLEAEAPLPVPDRELILDFIEQAAHATAISFAHDQQESLRRSEEQYRLLVESARDFAIFMLDAEGRIATWNVGAERMMGFTADQIIGQPSAIIFVPEDRESGEAKRELQTAATQGRAEDERWHMRKDGSRFFASGVLMRMDDGEASGFAKVMRDVTERKRMEEALEQRAQALESVDRQKDQFLALLAHELRNPLMPMRNAIELLKRGAGTEPLQRRAVEIIERQVGLQARLLDDLLNVNRIVRGKISLEPKRLDMSNSSGMPWKTTAACSIEQSWCWKPTFRRSHSGYPVTPTAWPRCWGTCFRTPPSSRIRAGAWVFGCSGGPTRTPEHRNT